MLDNTSRLDALVEKTLSKSNGLPDAQLRLNDVQLDQLVAYLEGLR